MSNTKNKPPIVDRKFIQFKFAYDGYLPKAKFIISGPGQLAVEMIQKWGMVAAVDGGEDSAGRARVRLATPAELIERACTVTELLWEESRKREWLEAIPEEPEAEESND